MEYGIIYNDLKTYIRWCKIDLNKIRRWFYNKRVARIYKKDVKKLNKQLKKDVGEKTPTINTNYEM